MTCSTCVLLEGNAAAPGYPHECGDFGHRNYAVTFAKPCPKCGGSKGRGTYEYQIGQGYTLRDTWTCACGAVYYHWEWRRLW